MKLMQIFLKMSLNLFYVRNLKMKGATISTVEHLMAAFYGEGIDNGS